MAQAAAGALKMGRYSAGEMRCFVNGRVGTWYACPPHQGAVQLYLAKRIAAIFRADIMNSKPGCEGNIPFVWCHARRHCLQASPNSTWGQQGNQKYPYWAKVQGNLPQPAAERYNLERHKPACGPDPGCCMTGCGARHEGRAGGEAAGDQVGH